MEDGKWGKTTISGEKGINKFLLNMGEKKKKEFELFTLEQIFAGRMFAVSFQAGTYFCGSLEK